MKKLLLFFTVFAFALTGCEKYRDSDYACSWEFEIENNTDSEIVCLAATEMNYRTTVIKPGETKGVFSLTIMCGKGDRHPDMYKEGQSIKGNNNNQITIDGEAMPDEIWLRDYWDYTDCDYYGLYTLKITDELIEILKKRQL